MALYCNHHARHRGRLYLVPLRYGSYGGGGPMKQVKGKPLQLSEKDRRKIIARAEQAHSHAGCFDNL